MKQIIYSLLFLLAISPGVMKGQTIKGTVIDNEQYPIEGAAVIMQSMDSVFIEAVVTDSVGAFLINRLTQEPCRLLFQHLMYETLEKEITDGDLGIVQLVSKEFTLGEIVVKGERPTVRVEGGTLSYDVAQLIKDKTATTAFEAIKELPGVTGTDESIELVGARSLQIILNGQLTTMSLPQLIQLLKSMPASRVQKAEVMYNAPARYNVKGALINVVIENMASEGNSFQGEAGTSYEQKHYGVGGAHANLLYSTEKFSLDFLLNGRLGRSYVGEDMIARHTLDNTVTEIEQTGRSSNKGRNGDVRIGMDYTFNNNDKLSAAYYLSADKSKSKRNSTTWFTPLGEETTESISKSNDDGHSTMQNVRIQYDGHAGLMAGADYTRYDSPSELYFTDNSSAGTEVNMKNTKEQTISRYSVFLNQSHTLDKWQLNYGVQGGYATSDNHIEYLYDTGNGYILDPTTLEDNIQKDYTGNIFAETSTSFGPRFTATIGLKGEYFKSDYKTKEEKVTLWDEWTLFPTVSLSYTFSAMHILQLNVSSDKTYPTYWNLSPQRYPLNSYSEVVGNPELKPYRSYDMQLLYILKQKYMFMAFCNYEPDYFTQVPYQSDEEMKNVFRYENFDYGMKVGLVAIIPFRVGSFWNSRASIQGFRMQEKSDYFHGMSFNRNSYVGVLASNNTFNISQSPNLKLTIDAQYVTKGAIQGIYDLGYIVPVSAGLKWTFAEERASLTLKANDIFRSGYPNKIEINQGKQWSRLEKLNDLQSVSLTFVYKFGGYKAKEHQKIDTSRFGQ